MKYYGYPLAFGGPVVPRLQEDEPDYDLLAAAIPRPHDPYCGLYLVDDDPHFDNEGYEIHD